MPASQVSLPWSNTVPYIAVYSAWLLIHVHTHQQAQLLEFDLICELHV
jgi:hypothetical protein